MSTQPAGRPSWLSCTASPHERRHRSRPDRARSRAGAAAAPAPAMGRHAASCWVFGYASLIWRPEFDAAEHRSGAGARLAPRAAHALARQPRHAGAAGAGVRAAARRRLPRRRLSAAARQRRRTRLERLWAREMPTGVYDARWLPCRTPQGPVRGAGLHAQPPQRILPAAPARAPSCCTSCATHAAATAARWSTWPETAAALRERGVRDREIERLMALARRHTLL